MSLTAVARAIPGTLRQDIEIDGLHHVITDEPERIGGDGSAPSPHELVPAALAACISTHLVMYARTKDWDLGDVSVAVDYDHRATPRQFAVHVLLGAELTRDQLDRLHKVAVSCPVRKALRDGAEFTERIEARPAAA
jgi:putative redox protein